MTEQRPDDATFSPPRPVESSRGGLAVGFIFFLGGAGNYFLLPRTGGLLDIVWSPLLFDLALNPFFLVLVYIPLIQLPLAVSFYQRSALSMTDLERTSRALLIFAGFGLLWVVRVILLIATTAYPWGAGGVRAFVDTMLYGELLGLATLPDVLNLVFLFYFPSVVAVCLLATGLIRRPAGGTPAETMAPPLPNEEKPSTIATPPPPEGPDLHASAEAERRFPYWGLVGVVVLLLVGGGIVGGLESAISIAGLLISLYQLQPERD